MLLPLTRALAAVHGLLALGCLVYLIAPVVVSLAVQDETWDAPGVVSVAILGLVYLGYPVAVGAAAVVALLADGPYLPHAGAAVGSALPVVLVAAGSLRGDWWLAAYVVLCAATLTVAVTGLAAALSRASVGLLAESRAGATRR